MPFYVKRVYDPPEKKDGYRVLVDRVWPRGLKKETAQIDEWIKEIAPSTALRKWFHHDPAKWSAFKRSYFQELQSHPETLDRLRQKARQGPVTLVYAAKDRDHNNAVCLKELLETS